MENVERAGGADAAAAAMTATGCNWDFIHGETRPAAAHGLGSGLITINGHTRAIAGEHLSDMEVAGRVRMLMRADLDHEAVCTLARDRIVYLADQLRLATDLAGTVDGATVVHRYRPDRVCVRVTHVTEHGPFPDDAAARAVVRVLLAKGRLTGDELRGRA